MVDSLTVSYYLSLIGGSFTILSGTGPLIVGYTYAGDFSVEWQLFHFLIITGSGIVGLIFGHRLVSKPTRRLSSSIVVIVMSFVAWWGIIASRGLLLTYFTSQGPFLSLAGGIVGLSGTVREKAVA